MEAKSVTGESVDLEGFVDEESAELRSTVLSEKVTVDFLASLSKRDTPFRKVRGGGVKIKPIKFVTDLAPDCHMLVHGSSHGISLLNDSETFVNQTLTITVEASDELHKWMDDLGNFLHDVSDMSSNTEMYQITVNDGTHVDEMRKQVDALFLKGILEVRRLRTVTDLYKYADLEVKIGVKPDIIKAISLAGKDYSYSQEYDKMTIEAALFWHEFIKKLESGEIPINSVIGGADQPTLAEAEDDEHKDSLYD